MTEARNTPARDQGPTDAGTPLAARAVCYHCGQAIPPGSRWHVTIEGQDCAMCCAGCEAVARAIVAAGMEDYYRRRTGPAAGPEAVPEELAGLALYDEPELQARFVRGSGETLETTLLLEGLRCGACVWLIERTLAAQPGVTEASVNFATERAVLRWDPSRTRLSALLSKIAAVGYRALPYDAQQREAQLARTTKSLFKRMFVAGMGMMQVMMYAVPVYTAAPGEIDWQFEHLMRWASFLLTIPVVLYSAQPFFGGALRDLRARSLGMDVPVAIGLAAAFAASTWATLTREGEVYFDSVTMFVFLLLGARYLEWVARRRASRAVDAMAAALPEQVERLAGLRMEAGEAAPDESVLASTALETVPAARLAPGDLLRLPVGARIPVDATIVGGATAIDQSLLTGESIPVPRQPGDEVPGGAINAGSPVWLRVTRASGDSTLSTIERLIERAALEKPALARLADRVASGFVIALLGFAAIVLLAWSQIDPDRALPIAIAVLVVSCPCALSLATPAALAAATGAATRNGALVASGVALETIAGCTDVVFDKTGTLTEGRPGLARIDRLDDAVDEATVLSLAAGLETGSPHPLAKAIVDAAHARGLTPPPAVGLLACAGLGVEGTIGERALRIGSAAFVGEWSTLPELPRAAGSEGSAGPPQASFTPSGGGLGEAQPWGRSEAGAGPPQACFTPSGGGLGEAQPWGRSEVWLVERGRPIARFELLDTLRAEARETVDLLHAKGLAVHLLSGDHAAAVDACARTLGIPSARAQASPADKLDYVRELQAKGRRVLMVGDGVNDAPVLAAADASLAVGHATALAKTAADAVLLSSDITMVSRLIGLARQTRRIIVENLWWATAYNLIAIPAAAMGWVPPWLAAIGMSGSSLLVVGNALRLRIASPRALHSK